jgi:hypothetical protein
MHPADLPFYIIARKGDPSPRNKGETNRVSGSPPPLIGILNKNRKDFLTA